MTDARTSEDGVTLIELLVALTIFMVVLGAVLGVLTAASRGVNDDAVRTQSAIDAQTGIARMVRELRGAYRVSKMSGTLLEFDARINGQPFFIQYDCGVATPNDPNNVYAQYYRRCVRKTAVITDVSADDPALPANGTIIVDRICPGTAATCAAADVFTCRTAVNTASSACAQLPDPPPDPDNPTEEAPDPIFPTLVEINIQVPARGWTKS